MACCSRRRRDRPRSFSGWKNIDASSPRHAASTCQSQFSDTGVGSLATSDMILGPFQKFRNALSRGVRNERPGRFTRSGGKVRWIARTLTNSPSTSGSPESTAAGDRDSDHPDDAMLGSLPVSTSVVAAHVGPAHKSHGTMSRATRSWPVLRPVSTVEPHMFVDRNRWLRGGHYPGHLREVWAVG